MPRLGGIKHFSLLLCMVVVAACGANDPGPRPPATRKVPVTDTHHGVQVVDDYRWLEDWTSPDVRQWSDAQNTYTRDILNRLESRDLIGARVKELRSAQAESYFAPVWRNGKLFAMKRQPPKQQSFLIVMDSPDEVASARTVVDPNLLDPTGGTTIDFYEPSWDGKLIAISLSKGGSESGRRPRVRRDRQAVVRGRSKGPGWYGWRRPGLGRRQLRFLLHPLSAQGRTTRRGSVFLSAGLFPQARRVTRHRPVRARQGFSAGGRDSRGHASEPQLPRRLGPTRRRRWHRALPPVAGRQMAAPFDDRRSRLQGALRTRQRSLPGDHAGRPSRQGPSDCRLPTRDSIARGRSSRRATT